MLKQQLGLKGDEVLPNITLSILYNAPRQMQMQMQMLAILASFGVPNQQD